MAGFEEIRNNLIAAFRGRALRNDGAELSDKERAGMYYIESMDKSKVDSIMSDGQLSDAEFKQIMKDAEGSLFVQSKKNKDTEDMMDQLVKTYNQGAKDAATQGQFAEIKKAADTQIKANEAKAPDEVQPQTAAKTQKVSEPKEEKSWFGKAWDSVKDWASEHPVLATVGAVVGTAALVTGVVATGGALAGALASSGTYAGLGVVAGAKAALAAAGKFVLGAAVPAGILAASTINTSCGPDDIDPGKRDVNATQTVQITIKNNENMETLLDYLATLVAQGEKNGETMNAVLNAITRLIVTNQSNADEIIKLIGDNNDLLGTVVTLLIENNELLKKNNKLITEFAAQSHNDNKAILKAVIALQKGLNGITQLLKDSNKLLANLPENIANEFKGKLNEILNAINQGNMSLADLQGKMQDVIRLLAQIKDLVKFNDMQNDVIIRLLEKINAGQELTNEELMEALELLNGISDTTTEISEDVKKSNELLTEIRDLMKNMGSELQAQIEKLINIAGTNTAQLEDIKKLIMVLNNNVVFGNIQKEQILKAINALGIEMAHGMNAIIGAINENTAVSKGMKATLEAILAKMGEMDDNNKAGFKAVLDALTELSAKVGKGETVDLSTIEELLRGLTALNKEQNTKLDVIVGQNDIIIELLKGIKAKLGDNDVSVSTYLQTIIDKIGQGGCHCDVDKLVEKLNQIIIIIKDNTKPNEGIIGELDDLIS